MIRSGCRIGDLAEFIAYDLHDRADFFNDDVDIDFEADLDGIEVVASLEPKRFKPTDPPTGTRTVSATLQLAEKAKKAASSLRQKQEAVAAKEAHNAEDDEEDFESIPW